MLRAFCLGIAALGPAMIGGVGSAEATTINFDGFAFNDSAIHDLTPISGSLSLDGFTFTAGQFTKFDVFGTQEGRFAGQVAMFNNANFGATMLTRVGGGTFSLLSLDVANILGPGADSITLHGQVHGGGTVSESFAFNSFGHLTTLTLDRDFRDLDSVSFDENPSPGFQFTDLVVSTEVAEPAGLALFGVGLAAGLAFLRKRRA